MMNWLHRLFGAEADKEELESLRKRDLYFKRGIALKTKEILDLECENARLKEEKNKIKKEVRRLNQCLQSKSYEVKAIKSDYQNLSHHYNHQRDLLREWQEAHPMNGRGGPVKPEIKHD